MTINKLSNLIAILRLLALALVFAGVNSCGGGLVGSGNGGGPIVPESISENGDGDSDGSLVTVNDRFILSNLPHKTLATLPSSIVATATEPAPDEPYRQLAAKLGNIAKLQLQQQLAILLIDTNWQAILEFCSTTPEDSKCDLEQSGVEALYTPAIAAWEYNVRVETEKMLIGSDNLPSATTTAFRLLTSEKIGTTLAVNNGYLRKIYAGGYRYEIRTAIQQDNENTTHTLRWSEDKNRIRSIVGLQADHEQRLATFTYRRDPASGIGNGTALLSVTTAEKIEEFQFNFQEELDSETLNIKFQLSLIESDTKTDHYSVGRASKTGGYLKTEIAAGKSRQDQRRQRRRETFSEHRQITTADICAATDSDCTSESDWQSTMQSNTIESEYYLTDPELLVLAAAIPALKVSITGVPSHPDSFVLLDQDKINFNNFSRDGVFTIGIDIDDTGYGPSISVAITHTGLGLSSTTGYAGAVLCRVNNPVAEDGDSSSLKSFCAADADSIRNAVVISETYESGNVVTVFHPSANIRIE